MNIPLVDMRPVQACEDKERERSQDWPERALDALLIAGKRLGRFTIEQARLEAYRMRLVEEPHDERAWGAVIIRASRGGYIVHHGFDRARSSHGSPQPVWRLKMKEMKTT